MKEDGRGKKQKYSDEELIEWIKTFKVAADMRKDNIYMYYACRKRGLKELFPPRKKVSNEELIEWIKTFSTIRDMRTADLNKYILCTKRGLREHFPKKLTRCGNIVGTEESTKEEKKALREEKKRLKELSKIEKIRLKKEDKQRQQKLDSTVASRIYRGQQLENGNIICGRCLEESSDISRNNKSLCNKCYNRYMSLKNNNKDHNKWNIRDEYCNTIIKHHEKTFEIGIKVDERTMKYLSLIGYDFIFKDVYDI